MKKLLILSIAAAVACGQLFCSGAEIQRRACHQACKTAKNNCQEQANKAKTAAERTAKGLLCNASHEKCLTECNK